MKIKELKEKLEKVPYDFDLIFLHPNNKVMDYNHLVKMVQDSILAIYLKDVT